MTERVRTGTAGRGGSRTGALALAAAVAALALSACSAGSGGSGGSSSSTTPSGAASAPASSTAGGGSGGSGGGSSGGSGSGTTGGATSGTGTTGGATSGTGSSGGAASGAGTAAAGTAECASSQLSVAQVNPSVGAGQYYSTLVFTNTSGGSCVMTGYPGVSYVVANGVQSGNPAVRAGGTASTVTLAPGGKADAVLHDSNGISGYSPQQCRLTPALGLRIYPPDNKAALFLPWSTSHCAGLSIHPLSIGPITRA
ncbi:DUF4232 domain-containing protein [Streptacidiphilus sp. P02-A3a]|uniref:DUF4232 domain-containing protein n=1 Tax=Streptacidiphilus sp. P02-A3a TaxID=2704468 RepID=UPI0015FCB71B|nr:DUF4232 domain-containing protein [Streptacidiphilus sp. P02-A3a]QMU67603.1 DUF4232 domain-containing protein [Streptacidiphilus sp. P02-A3a]